MQDKNQRIKKASSMIFIHIFPIIVFLSLEILNVSIHQRGYSSITGNIPAIVISCIFIYLLMIGIYALSGNFFLSGMIVSLILLTFYIINFYRRLMTGTVFLPMDLNLTKQLGRIVSPMALPFDARIIYASLLIIAFDVLMFFASKKWRTHSKKRFVALPVAGILLGFMFFTQFSREKVMPVFNIGFDSKEEINLLYETSGALMGFYSVCFFNDASPPESYGEKYMDYYASRALSGVERKKDLDGVKPDVIVIMSEAFMDTAKLPNVTFSEDPAPNLHKLMGLDSVVSGNTISPAFGGMTCNPEYEFLTGFSMAYVKFGETPYYMGDVYIGDDSSLYLAGMFKQNGYKTVGLHTNTISFYGRDQHYPRLGFDEFIGEEMMPDAKYKGILLGRNTISDEYFMDKVIELSAETEEPLFLFGVTMQNHYAYLPDKYESTLIKAESEFLTDDEISSLEMYIEGIHDIDAQLGRLYEYVMNCDKPTIVVYFGDHLPIITQNSGVYAELGYISEKEQANWSTDDNYNMFTTPYIVFSNYLPLSGTWGEISPYFLGALTADAAGIEINLHYAFLNQAYKSFHALTEKLFVDSNDVVHSGPLQENDKILEMFYAFQYDKLYGENFTKEKMSAIIRKERD